MIIYRLEHRNGNGVYNSEQEPWNLFCDDYLEDKYSASNFRHPSPYDDIPGWESMSVDYIFGFSSIEMACEWFYLAEDLELFEGVILSSYEVDDCVSSDRQVVFDRTKARRLGWVPCTFLHPKW